MYIASPLFAFATILAPYQWRIHLLEFHLILLQESAQIHESL